MKIVELEIRNIRGIRHLHLRPNEKTTVIFGPNGTGKSAVIDAVDFLLTGNISRLLGSGTRGITLRGHGKHVDAEPAQSFVRGQLRLTDDSTSIEVVRRMSQPKVVEVDDAMRPAVEQVLSLASRRQFVLTRRELLRYVTADGGTRAKAVEELLDLQELKPVEKTLADVRRATKSDAKAAMTQLQGAKDGVVRRLGQERFDAALALHRINVLRATLDAPPLSELDAEALLDGATRPGTGADHGLRSALGSALSALQSVRENEATLEIGQRQARLMELLQTAGDESSFDRRVSLLRLASSGKQLLDADGACPLCETAFPPGDLLARLETTIERGQAAAELLAGIATQSDALTDTLRALANAIDDVVAAADSLGGPVAPTHLRDWASHLNTHADSVKDAAKARRFDSARQTPWLCPPGAQTELSELAAELLDDAGPTPEQEAWDTLSRLQASLQRLAEATATSTHADAQAAAAKALLDGFQASRAKVLSSLYEQVRERFEELYREMNSDEHKFAARLEPDGTSLEFTVDFHERGQNPPHALHSEGHQDSMGLCLYLALAERLDHGMIGLVLLDDVVMSVDAGHRRQFCRVLKHAFPGRQFLITTHDRVWAKQLQSEGVVSSKQLLEFGRWDIAAGPHVAQSDIWGEIDEAMGRGAVPEAAWRLRRGLEEFFGTAAGLLEAKVTYRSSGQYALEDVLGPSCTRLAELLKKGKGAANSWDNKEEVGRLATLGEELSSAKNETNIQRWGVNASVHYNGWAELSAPDFAPIVAAFRRLCRSFECPDCEAALRVTGAPNATDVRCPCGRHAWSLTTKPKS